MFPTATSSCFLLLSIIIFRFVLYGEQLFLRVGHGRWALMTLTIRANLRLFGPSNFSLFRDPS